MVTDEPTFGVELQAKADAEAAIELVDAARGAALPHALAALAGPELQPDASAPAVVVGAVVDAGFVRESEAEELLAKLEDESPSPDA